MVHQTLGVISPIPNCIDGETEAWEDKYWRAHSFRQPMAFAARTRRLRSGSRKAARSQPDWHLLLSPQSPVCLFVSVAYFAAVTDTYVLSWTLHSPHWTPGDCLELHLEPCPDLLAWSWCYFWVCWHCGRHPPLSLGSSLGLCEPHLCWLWHTASKGQKYGLISVCLSPMFCPLRHTASQAYYLPAEWKGRFEYHFCVWTVKWVWVHFSFALSCPFCPLIVRDNLPVRHSKHSVEGPWYSKGTTKCFHLNFFKTHNKNKYNEYIKPNPVYLMPVNSTLQMVNFLLCVF